MARKDRDMPDGGGSRLTPVVDEQTKRAAVKASAAASAPVAPVFTPTGNTFTDTLNKLRAERGITPEDVNAAGQLDVKGLTDKRVDAAQEVAAKPIMSQEQIDGGGVVKWIGGVNGKYEIVMPIGSPLVGSKAAGWESGRNPVKGSSSGSGGGGGSDSGSRGGGAGGGGGGGGGNTPVAPKEISDATRDAFAALTDLFASYGLESLAGEIAGYMTQGLTAAEALIKLKTNPTGAYATRFAGNFERVKKGLNVLSEAEYINLESSYAKTLKAYGLGNMVSSNRQDNYKKFAEFIAADISAVEFKDRIDLAVTRVKNADPFTRNTLKSFYNINDTDLVSYFLNPTENLPKLQQKVTAAEIGGSAVAQGLTTSLTSALSLAEFGIDKTQAQAGYRYIAQALPRGSFLSEISSQGGPAYTQGFAEDVVLRKSGKALTQQEKLIEEEASRFKASSGIAGSKSLASQNRSAF